VIVRDALGAGAPGDGAESYVRAAHTAVLGLMAPHPPRYWIDFLVTIAVAYAAYGLYLHAQILSILEVVTFLACAFAMYRAVVFTHEITHRPPGSFRAFTAAWNAL